MGPAFSRSAPRADLRAPARHRQRQAAFTLLELVLTIAVGAILFAALGSAVLVASRAMPPPDDPSLVTTDTAETLERIVEETEAALWFIEQSADAVTFTVPDRDSNGVPERIRYAWSGTAGDPLTRSYNGSAASDVLENVHEFALDFETTALDETYPGPRVESAETLLSSYTSSATSTSFEVTSTNWPGQYFVPALPADAVSWSVTRAIVLARNSSSSGGTTLVQIRTADASDYPTATVLGQQTLLESNLTSSYSWKSLNFNGISGLAPGTPLCLVLQFGSGTDGPARTLTDSSSGAENHVRTSTGGSSWSHYHNLAMLHYVYGKYLTPGPEQTATHHFVQRVRFTLRAGDDATNRAVASVRTLNTPAVLVGDWETDFTASPTADANGDGEPDFAVYGGGAFDAGSLSNGVWTYDTPLITTPQTDLTGVTGLRARLRTTTTGSGAMVMVNADQSGSAVYSIMAFLSRADDGSQTFNLSRMTSPGSEYRLLSVGGLTSDFVDLRLLVDATVDTVAAWINGRHVGTYSLVSYTPGSRMPDIILMSLGAGAEFDAVSVQAAP